MSNGFIRKAGTKAQDQAKLFAKQIGREPEEFLKSAKAQITKDTQTQETQPPLAQGVSETNLSEVSPEEKKKIDEMAAKRLKELEEELMRIRNQRKQREEEWSQQQDALMKGKAKQDEKLLIEPTTRPKRGMFGVTKQKQGTKEMGKQISG